MKFKWFWKKIKIRCAIYASTNIQAHEGWECIPKGYNDGGYSGGNME